MTSSHLKTMNQETDKLGALIILSGPSGAGKSTVCGHLFPRLKRLKFSVSCTTRAPRTGEVDGVHYHFLSIDEFKKRVDAGEFLEWAEVHGNYYGTLVNEVAPHILAGEDVILDIDVQGQAQIVENIRLHPDWGNALTTVFLIPPSYAILEQRLRGRGTESEESILRRLENAKKEMKQWRCYDYIIVNNDAVEAADELEAIIHAAHCRTITMKKEPWT